MSSPEAPRLTAANADQGASVKKNVDVGMAANFGKSVNLNFGGSERVVVEIIMGASCPPED